MTPFFTVVIPAFNSEAFIADTIASLAAQKFRSFEVIVVNDNSTDNTASIAQACLAQTGLPFEVMNKPSHVPQGVSHSRNLGIQMARGEWIALLDSDDFFAPEKLESIHAVILQNNGQPMLVHHALEWIDEETMMPVGSSLHQSSEGWQHDQTRIFQENFVGTSSVCAPRRMLQEAGLFDAALHGVEDYYMWMWLSVRYPIYYLNQLLGKYRVRRESLLAGRKFSYYVWQNGLLVNKMKSSRAFSNTQIALTEKYMLGSLLHYYAGKSIEQYGLKQFVKSFPQLFALRPFFAFQLYGRVLKGVWLHKVFSKN
jgi:glycosyltransferase involved in cell wall biosynthesis